jgi:hypothetical protein
MMSKFITSTAIALALAALLVPANANASQITVFDVSSFGGEIIAQNEFIGYGPIYFLGNTSGGVVSAFHTGNTYELAANNVSNSLPDTLNIYALWQGVTSPTGLLTVNTQMATDEYGAPGWTLSEVVYINGHPIVSHTQVSLGVEPNQSFTFQVGSGPFDLQLQLQYVSGPINGDFGSYVIASLGAPQPVPGPIVGAGLPGLLAAAGAWWYRRRRKLAG